MRETLAYCPRLDARLERQGLAGDTQFLVAGSILIGHSAVLILWCARRTVVRCEFHYFACESEILAAIPAVLSSSADRYRTRIWLRNRNVLLAGPASSAACTTFDRPNAKSNSAEVSALIIENSSVSPSFPAFCRASASSLRIPSSAPLEAWIRAATLVPPCRGVSAASTFANPETTWPALAAMASASTALRASRFSVSAASVDATRTSRLKPLEN